MKSFLLIIIAICCNFRTSVAPCMCKNYEIPSRHFCSAVIVAVVNINRAYIHIPKIHGIVYDSAIFEITVKQVLRVRDTGLQALASNLLRTYGSCGVTQLPEGKDLIITARVENGQAQIDSCNYHELWSDFDPDIKAGFLGGYKCDD